MYLPVAEASAVYAAVELAQLPVSLGQEKVDLKVEPLTIFHFLYKENLSEMLSFFNKDQHHSALVSRKKEARSFLCLF